MGIEILKQNENNNFYTTTAGSRQYDSNGSMRQKTNVNPLANPYLDASGSVQKTVDEKDSFEITKSGIQITINGEQKMTGTISSNTCDWKVPFKEGKTIINTVLEDPSGDQKDAVLTIEGKDGKVTLLAELKNMPDRKILIAIDKFEEKTN